MNQNVYTFVDGMYNDQTFFKKLLILKHVHLNINKKLPPPQKKTR